MNQIICRGISATQQSQYFFFLMRHAKQAFILSLTHGLINLKRSFSSSRKSFSNSWHILMKTKGSKAPNDFNVSSFKCQPLKTSCAHFTCYMNTKAICHISLRNSALLMSISEIKKRSIIFKEHLNFTCVSSQVEIRVYLLVLTVHWNF